ncbi:smoothelin-like 1 [Aplochiton taeniatus]
MAHCFKTTVEVQEDDIPQTELSVGNTAGSREREYATEPAPSGGTKDSPPGTKDISMGKNEEAGKEGDIAPLNASTGKTEDPKKSGEKEGDEEKEKEGEDKNSKGQVMVKNGENEKEGEEVKGNEKEAAKTSETDVKGGKTEEGKPEEEKKRVEKEKDTKVKTGKAADSKTKQAKEKEGAKEKAKGKDAEKQGKAKRKSGQTPVPPAPTAASVSAVRPRNAGRSLRPSTKNDIIAKFQQGAPETPLPRNFKLQKSSVSVANGSSIKQKILQWCRNKTRHYEGISIENFSSSWCDGMAFCALIHRFFPGAFDFSTVKPEERRKNFTLAFKTAESLADCCPLLEVDDMIMMGDRPDPLCVFTYVQALCQHLTKIEKERKDKEKEEGKCSTEEKVKSEKTAEEIAETETENGKGENNMECQKEDEKEGALEKDEAKEEGDSQRSSEAEGDGEQEKERKGNDSEGLLVDLHA